MSTKIGGPHRCNIHDFETEDTNEFNEHCLNTEGHYTSGAVPCEVCGQEITVENIPFQPLGKPIKLKCPDCYNKQDYLQQQLMTAFQNSKEIQIEETQQRRKGTGGQS